MDAWVLDEAVWSRGERFIRELGGFLWERLELTERAVAIHTPPS